jgi:ketosteroid isomerase-like protein
MSRENVERVRQGFQAYMDRDLEALLAGFTDDAEWRLIGGFADLMGSEFRGREALRAFFSDWMENLGGRAEIESVLEVEDRVVAIVRSVGVGGVSGAPATMRWGQVYSFKEGRVSAVDNYYEADEALAAVGLQE